MKIRTWSAILRNGEIYLFIISKLEISIKYESADKFFILILKDYKKSIYR